MASVSKQCGRLFPLFWPQNETAANIIFVCHTYLPTHLHFNNHFPGKPWVHQSPLVFFLNFFHEKTFGISSTGFLWAVYIFPVIQSQC